MSKNADTDLIQQLEAFGFDEEESEVYILLLSKGAKTALNISRDLKKPRTRVYRILDTLIERGFVIEVVEDRGRSFKAAAPERFDQFVEARKQEVTSLEKTVTNLKDSIQTIRKTISPESQIINFRGKDGIEQINWNSTKTNDVVRILEQGQQMENWMPHQKAERLRQEFDVNNVIVHQLTNETQFEDYTEIVGHVEKCIPKYISAETIALESDLIIYDNVIATYSKNDDGYFGVEIHDQTITTIMKQMFDHFWEMATPMEKTSKYGAAEIRE